MSDRRRKWQVRTALTCNVVLEPGFALVVFADVAPGVRRFLEAVGGRVQSEQHTKPLRISDTGPSESLLCSIMVPLGLGKLYPSAVLTRWKS